MAAEEDGKNNEFLVALPPWLFVGAAGVIFATINLLEYPAVTAYLWILGSGVVFAFTLLVRSTLVPSLLLWSRRDKLEQGPGPLGKVASATSVVGCPVCGDDKCARHRGEVSKLQHEPWEGVQVRKEIDRAFSRFMELLMQNYVEFWYKEVSKDPHGERLLRVAFRHMAAILAQRLAKIDIAKLISGKIVQAAMYHMNMYVAAKRKVGRSASMDVLVDAVFREYGPRLHRALQGGTFAERQYQCHVAQCIMPHLVPPDVMRSRGLKLLVREIFGPGVFRLTVDTIADPDFVNKMLIVLLAPAVPVVQMDPPDELVPLLDTFCRQPLQPPSLMMSSLHQIKMDTQLLLPFMNFLKARGVINLLQFCLETGEFQDELDQLTTNPEEKTAVLRKVRSIYTSYFEGQSADDLHTVVRESVEDIRLICEAFDSGESNRAFSLLQENLPIARAYSKIYGLLERDYVPLFLNSNEHLALICGDRFPKLPRLRSIETSKRLEPLKNLAKLGRRLKKSLRSSSSDSANYYGRGSVGSSFTEPSTDSFDPLAMEGEEIGEDVSHSAILQDHIADAEAMDVELSGDEGVMVDKADLELGPAHVDDFATWKVSILSIESRYAGKRSYFVYKIQSEDEGDASAGSRMPIARRFSEFFVLHKRLTEFHDDIGIQLPVKKLINLSRVTPKQTLERNLPALEKYLQQLVQHPSLKRSQALYNFLANPAVLFEKRGGVNLKALPHKLKTEVLGRGQHLEGFLSSFLASTFSPVPEHSAEDLKKILKERDGVEKLADDFSKMAAHVVAPDKQYWTRELPEAGVMSFDGLFDVIIYMMDNLFRLPKWLHVVLFCGKVVGHKTLDAYLDTFLLGKVEILKADATVIDLIELFTEVIFLEEEVARTAEQKEEQKQQALVDILEFFPGVIGAILGQENFHDGCKELIDVLQSTELNKQLVYTLLDIGVEELFPEVCLGQSSST